MACWLVLRTYQTVLHKIILKKKSIFLTISCKIPFKIMSNYYFFIYFFIFCNLKKIKYNSLVTVWNALGLSQQTTVSLNYSQSIKIIIGPSDGGTIISSSRRPTVIYQRLTDFKISRKKSQFYIDSLWYIYKYIKYLRRWHNTEEDGQKISF